MAAHRRGWRTDGLDGGRSDCYGLSVRTANGTPCCSATLFYHVCRAASVSRACFAGAHALDSCASVQSGHAALLLLHATPFPVCQSFCAHVVSCIFPVLSFDVGILPVVCCMRCGFLLLLRVMWSSCLSFVACKASSRRRERSGAWPFLASYRSVPWASAQG